MKYLPDDFDDIQCEEVYVEDREIFDNYGKLNNRRNSKQSHSTRESLQKIENYLRREAKKKERARDRMLKQRLQSCEPISKPRKHKTNSDQTE